MSGVRRSGRIAKEVSIVLLGTDVTGRVFSEQTKTVVLSRHGAGILSRYAFAPEETLSIRFPEGGREAEVRLVGKMGDSVLGHIYGVEFRDDKLNFWGLEFPGPEACGTPAHILLECSICHEQESMQQTEIESDVFLTTETVFRFCMNCAQTTGWRKAADGPEGRRATAKANRAGDEAIAAAAEALGRRDSLPSTLPALAPVWAEEQGTGVLQRTASAVQIPRSKVASGTDAATAARRENRRRHVRTRVSFTARVRVPGSADEIVQCENVSKGGLCFRSRRRYAVGVQIEVAAPYAPGDMAIFVGAVVKRAEEVAGESLYRYGVAYEQSAETW